MKTWFSYFRNSLFYSLSIFWIWIMGLQWISFMDFTWYEETKAIALFVITLVTVCEIVLPIKRVYRMILEGAAVFYIIYRELLNYWVYTPSGAMANRIQQYIENLSPYIWIALGAWFLMLISPLLVSTKRRILLFSGMNVIAFCIFDSFTPVDLWREVAWTVFAALGWLVSEHLRRFQSRFPAGWRRLRKYPLKILIHAAVLFTVIFVAGVNMPMVSPVLTDPYTAWVGGSGGVFSNGADVSGELKTAKPAGTSGYSRNDNHLGAGFDFDYSPVMSVKSDQRSYWRGESRKVYSGSGWSDSGGGDLKEVDAGSALHSSDPPAAGGSETLEQTVTMLNDNVYPVLFGAFHVTEIKEIDNAEGGSLFWDQSQSALRWNADPKHPQYPKTYTVVSELPVIPEDEIRGKTFKDLYGKGKHDVDEEYLQIPKDFPERTRKLAEQVTSTAKTPYEKIGLLQNYLINNFKYTNSPDLSKKNSSDFVDSFLFEVKEGYCDYFSTSMVMMARSLNIPARWVKGYAPGQQQMEPDAMQQLGGNAPDSDTYTITNADAHSWAEVYFGQYGWVPVEATPGFNMPLLTHQGDSEPVTVPEVEEEPQPEEQTKSPVMDAGSKEFSLSRAAVGWITALCVTALAAYALWYYRIPLRFLVVGVRKGQKLTADQKVIVMTERWLRVMKRKRIYRSPHETLRESVGRWNRERPALAPSLNALLMLFEKARYSPASISEAEWRTVYAHSRELRAALKHGDDQAA
ncbi:DUF4129 domain-containing protein [Paenibacillus donghaensis]|uniref:DUF4129 domain-containing transglutaminase family protein n=1 Tax=Paenibacillus donghaensis TaxID=414771 RepID=UPI0018831BBF|nr:transglutaminase domain-containing protein [Paenibacillus donghaensis]MBE9915540.1 DUF4129 domain-containing protein [Paenibacillus donghaensis]